MISGFENMYIDPLLTTLVTLKKLQEGVGNGCEVEVKIIAAYSGMEIKFTWNLYNTDYKKTYRMVLTESDLLFRGEVADAIIKKVSDEFDQFMKDAPGRTYIQGNLFTSPPPSEPE